MPSTLAPGARIGPYEITAQIGAGGMGEVFRATDTNLKRQVAIKVLPAAVAGDGDRLARFQREAEVLATLNHPHIAAIYGLEKYDGTIALVMELVEGPTLADRIAQGALPLEEALPIARQIAGALEAAHEQGIVHRDLKPANVKVTPGGVVKVLDFGLAKAIEQDSGTGERGARAANSPTITTPAMTRAGTIMGTAAYMSPEQARGKPVDKRADIWAFGVVLSEMLTGKPLFAGDTVSDVLAAVLTREPDWSALPDATPPSVSRLLRRCLARDPRERLHDIADARLDLDDEDTLPGGPPASEKTSRAGWLSAVALAGLAAGAGFVLASWWQPRTAPIRDSDVLRFEVPLPEGTSMAGGLSLSPDGRSLAFSARDAAGRTAIWTREMGGLVPRRLDGTDGGRFPFWSPDGRQIGFFAGGSLQVMDLIAQVPRAVASTHSASDARGANWGAGDVIIYAPSYTGHLMRVLATGGEPQPATRLDSTAGEGTHRWPSFLPDGRHFVFYVGAGTGIEPGEIHVGEIGSTEHRLVTVASSAAVFLPPSFLVYASGRTLIARHFDLERLELQGEPVPMGVEMPRNTALAGHRALSAAPGQLAYQIGPDIETALVWFDRRGTELNTVFAGQGWMYGPRLAPDDERVAVLVYAGTTPGGKLWVVDPARNNQVKMTTEDRRDDQSAVWSRDGTQLALTGLDSSQAVYVMDSRRPRSERRLGSIPGLVAVDAWLPGGEGALVTMLDAANRLDIHRLTLAPDATPTPFVTTPASEQLPEPSPDGNWLAYMSDTSGRDEVYVRRMTGDDQVWRVSTEGGSAPAWRSDGRELFYVDSVGRLQAVPTTLGASFTAGRSEPLFVAAFDQFIGGRQYDVSRDGRRFLINRAGTPATSPMVVVRGLPRELEAGVDKRGR